ncbi:histidine--tRNA ligase [Candidatus Kaiserbacteria bacterium]|nr:histidine--tRNA ligase [Candidatus Kaiserbacteria bacterium]
MADKLSTDPYKGVRDFYPEDMAIQRYIFDTWANVAESYGFERYDASVLEPAELYRAKTGEEIVNEQTYTFRDRGDREVTLRPEMTPTVARMVAARRRELSFPLRWYSIPNLFRYERTQRGRLREHWQLNCDIFGADNQYADAEIIALAYHILKKFGAQDDDFVICVNDRGLLNEYFSKTLALNEEQTHKMYKLLDRKEKIATFAEEASEIIGKPLDERELNGLMNERLSACLAALGELGVRNVEFRPSIVRGFDYYDGIVFEVFDTSPENNRSLFGGGRYNNLTTLFGGDSIPAIGFGMGDVTMRDFLETHKLLPNLAIGPRVMLLVASPAAIDEAFLVREEIRGHDIPIAFDFSGRKLKDQIAQAAKRNIPYVIVVGDDEVASGTYTLRNMSSGEEVRGTIAELIEKIR